MVCWRSGNHHEQEAGQNCGFDSNRNKWIVGSGSLLCQGLGRRREETAWKRSRIKTSLVCDVAVTCSNQIAILRQHSQYQLDRAYRAIKSAGDRLPLFEGYQCFPLYLLFFVLTFYSLRFRSFFGVCSCVFRVSCSVWVFYVFFFTGSWPTWFFDFLVLGYWFLVVGFCTLWRPLLVLISLSLTPTPLPPLFASTPSSSRWGISQLNCFVRLFKGRT